MNVELILETLNRRGVRYVMIGGMNFMLRHAPVLTFDVDLWIEDTPENRERCEAALAELNAEWGAADNDWQLVSAMPAGWLGQQSLFCLISPEGSIDIFRNVAGLDSWQLAYDRSVDEKTAGGVPYRGLSDSDMLRCQYALDQPFRKVERIAALEAALKKSGELP